MWLRTSRGRGHADALLGILDPHGMLFAGRVIVEEADGATGSDAASAQLRTQRQMAVLEARASVGALVRGFSYELVASRWLLLLGVRRWQWQKLEARASVGALVSLWLHAGCCHQV